VHVGPLRTRRIRVTDAIGPCPRDRCEGGHRPRRPNTYVPRRKNQRLLSVAAGAWAEVLGLGAQGSDIFSASTWLEYPGLSRLPPELHGPPSRSSRAVAHRRRQPKETPASASTNRLLELTKAANSVTTASNSGVDFGLTHQLLRPLSSRRREGPQPAAAATACLMRKKGFAESQLEDPHPATVKLSCRASGFSNADLLVASRRLVMGPWKTVEGSWNVTRPNEPRQPSSTDPIKRTSIHEVPLERIPSPSSLGLATPAVSSGRSRTRASQS